MTTSTNRKLTGLKYGATLIGALAVVSVAPATAFATDNQPNTTTSKGGCLYLAGTETPLGPTDFIPLDNGQSIVIDGKTVSCKDGDITVTPAPKRGAVNAHPPVGVAQQGAARV
jgi:hypothetical protein